MAHVAQKSASQVANPAEIPAAQLARTSSHAPAGGGPEQNLIGSNKSSQFIVRLTARIRVPWN